MSKIKIIKGFIAQRSGNSISIFDAEKSFLYTFNSTSTFIFDRLKKGLDDKKIVADLVAEYQVTEEIAKKDMNDFIEILLSKGLAKKEK